MKVAHVISNLSYGGAERQLLMLCRDLQAQGHSVAVASMKSGGELADEFRSGLGPVREFGLGLPFNPLVFRRVRRWLRDEAPDIVHAHLFKAEIYGGLAALSLGIPLVCTKCNEDPFLRNPFLAWLARRVARGASATVAVSQAVQSHYVRVAGLDQGRIEVIPLGIAPPKEVSASGEGPALRLGIVARLVEQKGHDVLLRAFAQAKAGLPGLTLSIVGTGPEEARLTKLAQTLELGSSVAFRGIVLNPKDIYDFDVLVLPSRWEGAGLCLLEAMSRGIPVIASNVGGIPEIVTQECGVLVSPGEVEQLANAIVTLARDRGTWQRLSEGAQRHASKHSSSTMVQKHLDLYERVLREKRLTISRTVSE